jgi:hypothetical protein
VNEHGRLHIFNNPVVDNKSMYEYNEKEAMDRYYRWIKEQEVKK